MSNTPESSPLRTNSESGSRSQQALGRVVAGHYQLSQIIRSRNLFGHIMDSKTYKHPDFDQKILDDIEETRIGLNLINNYPNMITPEVNQLIKIFDDPNYLRLRQKVTRLGISYIHPGELATNADVPLLAGHHSLATLGYLSWLTQNAMSHAKELNMREHEQHGISLNDLAIIETGKTLSSRIIDSQTIYWPKRRLGGVHEFMDLLQTILATGQSALEGSSAQLLDSIRAMQFFKASKLLYNQVFGPSNPKIIQQ